MRTTTKGLSRRPVLLTVPALLAAAALAISGCGSSKPAYCTHVEKLKQSVSGLNVSGGLSSIRQQADEVQTNAQNVITSLRSDFPDETSAVETAVADLRTHIEGLTSSPSAAQIAATAVDVKATVTAVDNLVHATSSKCS